MNRSTPLVFAVALVLLALLIYGTTTHSGPQVVVQFPKDAQALAKLDEHAKVVGSDRAVLWFSVFSKCLSSSGGYSAAKYADQAVLTVYGPTPSPSPSKP